MAEKVLALTSVALARHWRTHLQGHTQIRPQTCPFRTDEHELHPQSHVLGEEDYVGAKRVDRGMFPACQERSLRKTQEQVGTEAAFRPYGREGSKHTLSAARATHPCLPAGRDSGAEAHTQLRMGQCPGGPIVRRKHL